MLILPDLHSQDLRVGEFKRLPNDISAREHRVNDVNLEACAIIKVRTGLNNVKFFSNLSVEKVERRSGEYWVWVSSQLVVNGYLWYARGTLVVMA